MLPCLDFLELIFQQKRTLNIALEAIKKAKEKAIELNIKINKNPLLFVSLGINLLSSLENDKLLEKIEFLKNDAVDVIDIHFNEIDFLSNMKKLISFVIYLKIK